MKYEDTYLDDRENVPYYTSISVSKKLFSQYFFQLLKAVEMVTRTISTRIKMILS